MRMQRGALISALLLLLAVCAVGWRIAPRLFHPAGQTVVDPTVLHASWVEDTSAILASYDQDKDAGRARDALLALRVTADDKAAHQELVFAFEALATGTPDADARLENARTTFSLFLPRP